MVVSLPHKTGTAYGLESTWGTLVARTVPFGKVSNSNIIVNNNAIPQYAAGAGMNPTAHLYGNLDVTWNVDFELHDAEHLRLAVGPRSGSGSTAAPYILTEGSMVLPSTGIPPFSLEISSDAATDEGQLAEGCVANNAMIRFAEGAPLRVSLSGVAETVTSVSSATAYSEPSTAPFISSQNTVKWGPTPTTIARVLSGSIGWTNNLISQHVSGSRFIIQPEPGLRVYSFVLTVLMSDTSYATLRTSAYGGGAAPATGVTDSAFPITDELKLEISEGSASTDRNITIELDEVVINQYSQPVPRGNNLIQVTFTGTANEGKDNTPIKYWTAT